MGLARNRRQRELPGAFHLHFCGAAGNVTAGKYNDGSPENRPALADRLADGMAAALVASSAAKVPITPAEIGWDVRPVALPVARRLEGHASADRFADRPVFGLAADLAWGRRREAGRLIDLACLRLGRARVLHMPGELFIEYQLAAQRMRPDLFVAMAAYGDYGPGYIGTQAAYPQGGYEARNTLAGGAGGRGRPRDGDGGAARRHGRAWPAPFRNHGAVTEDRRTGEVNAAPCSGHYL